MTVEITGDVDFRYRKRYLVIFLSFLGFVNMYSLRVNMSVAIVAMTRETMLNETGNFDWDSKEQGYAVSAFFYGDLV